MTFSAHREPPSSANRVPEAPLRPKGIPLAKAFLFALGRLLVVLGVLLLLVLDMRAYHTRRRGIESGLSLQQPPLVTPRLGINIALERYQTNREILQVLASLRDLGYGTLRQRFAWADLEPEPGVYRWERWDYVLDLVQQEGFQVIAVLDGAPSWARSANEQDNPFAPPQNVADFARFAAAFAERYRDRVMAYQIWDEPNIAPHWGNREINPAEYVALLSAASSAIRQVDPDGLIVAGGLAPNIETGGRNLGDVQFLREIYRRGAGQWFDVWGVKAYGFWSGPYDRRVSADILNFSRVILLREEMVRRGEAYKPIWALDGGWVALPSHWQGRTSPLGNDDPLVQAQRLKLAIERVQREWPWMTLFCALHVQPTVPEDDPLWGLSLFGPHGQAQPLLMHLQTLMQPDSTLYPGLYKVTFSQGALTPLDLLVYWGSDLALWMAGTSQVEGTPQGLEHAERIWLARYQPIGAHVVSLPWPVERLMTVRAIQVGHRVWPWELWAKGVVALFVLAWGVLTTYRDAQTLPWRLPWQNLRDVWARLPDSWQVTGPVLCLLAALAVPHIGARLAFLIFYGVGALLRPDVALGVALVAIPLAPLQVSLGVGRFSIPEITVLAAGGALGGRAMLDGTLPRLKPRRFTILDACMVALMLWGAVSAALAEYQRVAWREFRLVVAEPVLMYALLRLTFTEERAWWRGANLLFFSAVAVAGVALLRYPFPQGVIVAEGVRRARAFYGSPNNLALYLERFVPLGFAMTLAYSERRLRWLYGAATALLMVAVGLTFSRGAWLLGLPAGLLAVGWLWGKHARRITLIVLVALGVMMLAFLQTPRFAALFDLTQGTGFVRLQLWRAAWDMAKDHPWLGVGPDNFLYYYGDYILPGAESDRWLSHPHNIFFDFWLRLGLPGLGLLGALIAFGAHHAWKWLATIYASQSRALLIGLIGGGVAAFAHGLVDAAWFVPELAFWGAFVLAYLASHGPAGFPIRRAKILKKD